jgi:ATP-dependent Lon protease
MADTPTPKRPVTTRSEISRPGISRRALLKAAGAAAAGAAVGGGFTSAAHAQVGQPVYRPEHAASGGTLPLVPIRDKVYFPGMIFPLFVGRDRSVAAVAEAQAQDGYLLLVAQKQMNVDAPGPEDLYEMGTVANVMQVLSLPDGTIRLMVEGVARARIQEYLHADPFYWVRAELLPEPKAGEINAEAEIRDVAARFAQFVEARRNIPPEALINVMQIDEPGRLADKITGYLPVPVSAQQEILATLEPRERLRRLGAFLDQEFGQ